MELGSYRSHLYRVSLHVFSQSLPFILFWALPCLAGISYDSHLQSLCDSHIHETKFFPSDQMVEQLKTPIGVLSASVRLSKDRKHCSGVVTSDQGHILTAGHCLEMCQPPITGGSSANQTCELEVNGSMTKFNVVASDNCPDLFCEKGDYAILKAVMPPANLPCLKFAKQNPGLGTVVASIGYPAATHRGSFDSDGKSEFGAFGKISEVSNCTFNDHGKKGSRDVSAQSAEARSKGYLQTTVDAAPGNSGGPVIDSTGNIIGLLDIGGFGKVWERSECPGSTYIYSAEAIQKELNEKNVDSSSVFSCSSNSAIH